MTELMGTQRRYSLRSVTKKYYQNMVVFTSIVIWALLYALFKIKFEVDHWSFLYIIVAIGIITAIKLRKYFDNQKDTNPDWTEQDTPNEVYVFAFKIANVTLGATISKDYLGLKNSDTKGTKESFAQYESFSPKKMADISGRYIEKFYL